MSSEIQPKNNELLKDALIFFQNPNNAQYLIDNHGRFSARLLNFFLSDYCKNSYLGRHYDICKKTRGTMMDSFRRNNKIVIKLNGQDFETSEAQIVFFKFAIDNNVFELLKKQLNDVIKRKKENEIELRNKKGRVNQTSNMEQSSELGFTKNKKVFICKRTNYSSHPF